MDFKTALQQSHSAKNTAREASQRYKHYLFQNFINDLATEHQWHHSIDPLMEEFTSKIRNDSTLEAIYRRIVDDVLSLNVENALFFANKLVTLTKNQPISVYLLGECYFLAEEYVKITHLFTNHDCLNLNENFAILASKGLLKIKGHAQVIKILTTPFKSEIGNKVFTSQIHTLVGKAQKFLENREEAETSFLNSLKIDAVNHIAFEGLCETRQFEDRNLGPTVESLEFPPQMLWVKKFYQAEIEYVYQETADQETPKSLTGTVNNPKGKDESPISSSNQMQIEYEVGHFYLNGDPVEKNFLQHEKAQEQHSTEHVPKPNEHKSPQSLEKVPNIAPKNVADNPAVRRHPSIISPEETKASAVIDGFRRAENIHYLYLRLLSHFRNFQINNAYDLCKKILEKDQFHFDTILIYCEILVEKEEIAELFSYSSRMVENFPEHHVTYHLAGMYYFYLKKYEAARRYFNKAIHINNYCLQTWLMLGHTYAAQEESDPASNVYRSALKLFPNSHLPHVYIGMEYLRINNLKTAAISFNQAKRIAGENPMIYNEIGCIYLKQKKYESAKKNLKKALRTCKANGVNWLKHSILNNLANVHRKEKDYQSSIQCYEQSLALCPNDPAVLFSLAFCYNLTGELTKAAGLYHKVISRKYDSHFVNHLLSKCMEDLADDYFESAN